MSSEPAVGNKGGRPAAASRDEVLALALDAYLHGRRVDVQAIAAELGLSRTTIYRWFGSREDLMGEAVATAAEEVIERCRHGAPGAGAAKLLVIFDRINRALAEAPALRTWVEHEREGALRIATSSGGVVQPRLVASIEALIRTEVDAGAYDPPVEPGTLAYAIVRLCEAFMYNDAIVGIRGDVERLLRVEAALLGVAPPRSQIVEAPRIPS